MILRSCWEQNQPIRVVAHTLTGIPGLPESSERFLRFGQWLEPNSAAILKPALDALFTSGQPFNVIVHTMAGGHLEAEGRTAGGRRAAVEEKLAPVECLAHRWHDAQSSVTLTCR